MRLDKFRQEFMLALVVSEDVVEKVFVMVDGNEFDVKHIKEDGDSIRIYLDE